MVIFPAQQVTIRTGQRETPAVDLPAGTNGVEAEASSENWPASPVTVSLLVSEDGQNFTEHNTLPLSKPVPNPKTPGIQPPVKFSFGWNAEAKTYVKAKFGSNSPSQFNSTVTIWALGV